jgi:hypothetical protein
MRRGLSLESLANYQTTQFTESTAKKILQLLTLVDILVQLALFKEIYHYIDASLDCPCR